MNDNTRPLFTIFTATFNRKNLLPRAYESVKAQTFRDFEWLIIDDGSTDETDELIKKWQAEADFPIVYKWQPNGGKHTAFDEAARIHRGRLITPLDSDDELVPETLERYKFHWDNLSDEQKNKVGCMICLSKDQNGNIVGDRFPGNLPVQINDLMKMYIVKKIKGEKGGVAKSEAFTMYPFPEEVRNVYVPESVFQHRLAKDWKALFINEVLRVYWIDERDDHDSDKLLSKENYPGNQLYHLAFLNYTMRLFWSVPKIFFANAVYYVKLSFHLGQGVGRQFKNIQTFSGRLVWLVSLPVGYVMYLKNKKKH